MRSPGPFAYPLGCNVWGNLRAHVALRHHPLVTGYVISDLGGTYVVADAENGWPLVRPAGQWVGVGSEAHRRALAKL